MTINVRLDINANPAVTVDEESVAPGKQTITWLPDANQPPFKFVDVEFLTTPHPFSGPTITTRPVCMTVTEDNKNKRDYFYKITVALGERTYDSEKRGGGISTGTPVIHNK